MNILFCEMKSNHVANIQDLHFLFCLFLFLVLVFVWVNQPFISRKPSKIIPINLVVLIAEGRAHQLEVPLVKN